MLSAPADDDLARLGEPEEPRGQVRRVPHRGVVHPQILADGADHDEARVDAHAHSELDAVHPSHVVGQRFELPLDRERTLGMVFMGDRRPEERHHPVAEELVDRALVAMNRTQDDLERAVHHRVDVLGIELLRHRREARHVREHHSDALSFSLQRAFRGEDLLGEVLRRVGVRGRELLRGWRGGHGGAALAAELVRRGIGDPAGGTQRLEACATLSAELHALRIFVRALRTTHRNSQAT